DRPFSDECRVVRKIFGLSQVAKLGLADLDNVPRLEGVFGNAFAIYGRARLAVQIRENHLVAVCFYLAMNARHLAVGERRLCLPASAKKKGTFVAQSKCSSRVGPADDLKLLGHGVISTSGAEIRRRSSFSQILSERTYSSKIQQSTIPEDEFAPLHSLSYENRVGGGGLWIWRNFVRIP